MRGGQKMTTKAVINKRHVNPMDRMSVGDRVANVITYIVYAFFAFVCAYPFYYIIINSISANDLSERGKVLFWPMTAWIAIPASFRSPVLLRNTRPRMEVRRMEPFSLATVLMYRPV